MKPENKKKDIPQINEKEAFLSLKGSASSTRTTFKISKEANNSLKWLSENFNIGPKEIFEYISKVPDVIYQAAALARYEGQKSKLYSIRKSFVININAYNSILSSSKESNIHRDAILDEVIKIIKKAVEIQAQKERDNLQIAIDMAKKCVIDKELKHLKNLFGDDHPIVLRFNIISTIAGNLCSAIENYLEKGIPIDPDDISQC